MTVERHADDAEAVDLREYARVVFRHKWLIIQVTLVAAVAAATVSYVQTPVYTATAQLVSSPPDVSGVLSGSNVRAFSQDPARRIATQVELFKSVEVARIAAEKIGYRGKPQALSDKVKASAVGQTDVIEVSATDTDPERAAAIANAMADAFVAFQASRSLATIQTLTKQIGDRLQSAKADLDRLDAEFRAVLNSKKPGNAEALTAQRDAALEEYTSLKQKYDDLQIQASLQQDSAVVSERAAVPVGPSAPRPIRNTALAGVLGLLLGIGLGFLRERLDDSVNSKERIEDAIGAPLLGVIPDFSTRATRKKSAPPALAGHHAGGAEAFRRLRTNVRFLQLDQPLRTVGVSSAKADEGKSTVAANLAISLAQSGLRIVLLTADLRKPSLHRAFTLPSATGLMGVLTGETPLESALQAVGVEGGQTLTVLTAGPVPPNPSEVLGSRSMHKALGALRERFDMVLVDLPPLLPVADAAVLAPYLDGVLLVARAGHTSQGELRHAREALAKVKATVLGGVLNAVKPKGRKGYYYYYSYEHYGSTTEANGNGASGALGAESGRQGSPRSSADVALDISRSAPQGMPAGAPRRRA